MRVGEAEQSRAVSTWQGRCIGNQPLATVVLKYRSRKALETLGLVPRSPTPDHHEDVKKPPAAKIKNEVGEPRGTKRRASPSTLETGTTTSDSGLLNESFGQVQRHLQSIFDAPNEVSKRLRRETKTTLLTLKMLRGKVMADNESDDDVVDANRSAKGPATVQEVISLSDSE